MLSAAQEQVVPIAMVFEQVSDALDATRRALTTQTPIAIVLSRLQTVLGDAWQTLSPDGWSLVCKICQNHVLYDQLWEDPLTRRARLKPRGYAGDAVIYIYSGTGFLACEATQLGCRFFSHTAGTSCPARAVRERRSAR